MPMDSIAVYIEPEMPVDREMRYAATSLLMTLGIRHRSIYHLEESVSYGATLAYVRDPNDALRNGVRMLAIQAAPSAATFFAGENPLPAGARCAIMHQGRSLPALFCDEPAEMDAEIWMAAALEDGSVAVQVDFLASAFWFLSRWEESKSAASDAWNRFRYTDSLFAHDPRVTTAIVDRYLALLGDLLHNMLAAGGRRSWWLPRWQNEAPFAFCATHDIDSLRKWHPRRVMGEAGRLRQVWRTDGFSGALERARRVAGELLHNPNPHDNVLELAEREREMGVTATYFFLAGRHHPNDAMYDLSRQKSVGRLIEQVGGLGHEIGLHGSFTTFDHTRRLSDELELLQRYAGQVVGQRQHFLRFDPVVSWPAYATVGFEYDSSMGFADQVGSRNGFSFPFFPYDLKRRQAFPFVEIPLLVMDATLYAYRRLDAQAAWSAVEEILERVFDAGGCFTMLWHNATFDELDMPGYGDIYWRALEWAQQRGAWIAPLADIARWWARRALETDANPDAAFRASSG